ncbi:MAG: tetratricopeptide repeat protein [Vicinamibacterales bacterium]
MKSQERHHLKQNEFAHTAGRVSEVVVEDRSRILLFSGVAVLILAIAGGFFYWRAHTANQAGALLGTAMATAQGQVAPPSTLPGAAQTPGTFPTEKARAEAAIKAYQEVIAAYPNTDAANVARYQLASELLAAGRFAEAADNFRKVGDAEASSFRGALARLGLAEALMQDGKQDEAIKTYTDLAAARDTALPLDGVLMELARANLKAGKTQDARAAFKRVVDEFPESTYATAARQQLTALN